ncbi:GNAT family N-acetyltransferase [Mucilaginibacter sp. Mucisp86]|uniref:GNAT family N-acetyltransferase n=1 Tax=Mucilaginibacter sp. Mucisp86 TaxID=3243060 RepID=UPI0039B63244
MSEMPLLTTDRLHLRGLLDSDTPQIMAIRSNAEVNKYLGRSNDITIDGARSFIKKIEGIISRGEGFYWAITLKDDNDLIGTICYWNLELTDKKAEIGYELYPDQQGKGLMQEALSAVLKYGFETAGFEVIAACPVGGNESSVKLLIKNGFYLAGHFPSDNGEHIFLDYQLTKDSWVARSHK